MAEAQSPVTSNEYKTNLQQQQQWRIDPHQDVATIPLRDLNPAHPARFQANTVLPVFERLRREDPVHLTEESQFDRYWSIVRYDDIKAIDTNHAVFSSDLGNGGIRLGWRPTAEDERNDFFHLPMFIMEDPPKHDDQRKVVAPMFTPRKLAEMSDLIRARAGAILDELPEGETFNWVRQVSVELTGQMLATLFDVPQEDRHLLIHWSDTVERIPDPNYFETMEEGFKELWKCFEYFNKVWQERAARSEPGDDLISFLAHGEATRNMAPNEFLGNMLLLIVGGNDTTRNSISGGVLALNEHPDQFAMLRDDPGLIPNMASEVIRWQSPVAHMCRTAMEDIEVGGKTIKKWDKVCMWYYSGNRDETAFDKAGEFHIDRKDARKHLAFGFGIHRCLGNRLAEMQLRIIWEEILSRFTEVELVGEPKYLLSSFIHGITDLPVQVRRK